MPKVSWMGSGLLRMLCAFALLSLAFAHKPPQVMAAAYEAASLRLPDGTFADICVSDSAIKHPLVHQFCEACMLASSTLLPPPDDAVWLLARFASLENRLGEPQHPTECHATLRQRARAPPAIA